MPVGDQINLAIICLARPAGGGGLMEAAKKNIIELHVGTFHQGLKYIFKITSQTSRSKDAVSMRSLRPWVKIIP